MSKKTKRVLCIGGFFAAFGILLVLATIFDLQVSNILADGGLVPGKYYSESFLCSIVEIAGAWPIWVAAVFAASVLTVFFHERGGAARILEALFFLVSAAAVVFLLRDSLKYAVRIYDREELLDAAGTYVVLLVIGLTAAGLVVGLAGRWIRRNLDSLLPFALAILCSCLCYFIIEIIKSPVGRMRYRGMHLLGDYSYFTPWYQISAARELLSGSGLVGDCFKSFPSGHTFSAGMSYILMMLPDVFPRFRTRKGKILSCVIPICYTGFVGFFRIAAGAHYFSDVLVGGTLAYLAVQVFRYVFLQRRGSGRSGQLAE